MEIIIFDWRSLLDNCQMLKLNCPWDNIAPFTVIREIILTSRSKSFLESKSEVHNNLIVSRNKETLLGVIIVLCSLWYILPWYPLLPLSPSTQLWDSMEHVAQIFCARVSKGTRAPFAHIAADIFNLRNGIFCLPLFSLLSFDPTTIGTDNCELRLFLT